MTCTCPIPFTEDDLMCAACEQAWIDGLAKIEAEMVPTGKAWDEYARQQG